MNVSDLQRLGCPAGDALKLAVEHMRRLFARGLDRPAVEAALTAIFDAPSSYLGDADAAPLARALLRPAFTPRAQPAPWRTIARGQCPALDTWSVPSG